MSSHARPAAHVVTIGTILVAGVGVLVSGLGVRWLALNFTLDTDPYVPDGHDYRTTAAVLGLSLLALAALAVVATLGRGVPDWLLATLVALMVAAGGVAVHDTWAAGLVASSGDPGAAVADIGIIWLIAPTTWPALLVVLVRPLLAMRGQVRGRSSLAPR